MFVNKTNGFNVHTWLFICRKIWAYPALPFLPSSHSPPCIQFPIINFNFKLVCPATTSHWQISAPVSIYQSKSGLILIGISWVLVQLVWLTATDRFNQHDTRHMASYETPSLTIGLNTSLQIHIHQHTTTSHITHFRHLLRLLLPNIALLLSNYAIFFCVSFTEQ